MRLIYAVIILIMSVGLYADDYTPLTEPKKIDGVVVEALETYANPKPVELALGAGIYPLDPYYLGFSFNAGFTYYFSTSWAWEIIHGSYAFAVQKDLTAQLAQNFGVNPQVIEKLNYLLSTNLAFIPTYGKTVLFKKYIQYIRTSFLLGPGFIKTTLTTDVGANIAARFDTYITETFSWRIEIRDTFGVSSGKNFLSFSFGTGIYF